MSPSSTFRTLTTKRAAILSNQLLKTMRTSLLLLTFSMLFNQSCTADDFHIAAPSSWSNNPVTPLNYEERIKNAAVEYQFYGQIARIGFYDIAYPRDASEYLAVNGFGVVLVTALSQTQVELPPKRVYIQLADSFIELKLLSGSYSQSDTKNLISKVLGSNRWDGLYLLPIYAKLHGQELLIDFAKNRDGFGLGKFQNESDDGLNALPVKKPTSENPSEDALQTLIKREYPGFLFDTHMP